MSFPMWQLHFLLTQMCFLSLGRKAQDATDSTPEKCVLGVALPAVGKGRVKEGKKGRGGAVIAGSASLLPFEATWLWANHAAIFNSAFVQNERGGHDKVIPPKQRRLIQWHSRSLLQTKVQNCLLCFKILIDHLMYSISVPHQILHSRPHYPCPTEKNSQKNVA